MTTTSTAERLQSAMELLVELFPGCAIGLLVAPIDATPDARTNWVSNSKREDMQVLMKEVVARWEGRGHEPHKTRQ